MGRLACVNVSLSPQTGVAAPENAAGGRVDFVCERLCGFSPKVEPRQMEPGIFWLSADGLEAVYPSLTHWALLLQTDLAAAGFETTVALGFDRFYTYALAKSAARSKSSGASRYMNILVPRRNIFIFSMPMLLRPDVTSGQTLRWYCLYRSMASASFLRLSVMANARMVRDLV